MQLAEAQADQGPGMPWVAGAAALAVLLGLATPGIGEFIVRAGRSVGSPDTTADYLRGVAAAVFIGVVILYLPVETRERFVLLALWAVKSCIALGPMLLYERLYPVLDTYYYYQLLTSGQWQLLHFGFGQGVENTVGVMVLASHLVGQSFHALKVVFALLGLAGIYAFYRATVLVRGRRDVRLLALLGLFPSILFWSTTLGKEPIALLGVGLYAFGVAAWQRGGRISPLAIALAGIAIASTIRLWFAPIMLLPMVWLVLRAEQRASRRIVLLALSGGALAFGVVQFRTTFQLETLRDLLSTANTVSRTWAVGGSAQQIATEFTSVGSVLAFLPRGAFTALFRPLPGEVMNPFGLLAGLENLALLVLLVLALVRARRAALREPMVQAGILMVCIWAAAYSVVSYQNLGAAVRYKLQILPVLLAVLLHLAFFRSGNPDRTES